MEYFVSHIGIVFIAAAFVAVCAVVWWFLTEKNARLIRERKAAARRDAQLGQSGATDLKGRGEPDGNK